jgi:hypothetical protein
MHNSTPRSLLPNWCCKSQKRCLYCWTGDSKINTDLFSADLVMKSKHWGPYYWADLKTLMVIDTDSIGVNPTNKRSWPWRPHLCVDINAWFYLRMYRICLHHQFNSKTSVLKFTSSSNWYRCWLLHHQLSSKDLSVYFSSPDRCGRHGHDRLLVGFTPMLSVSITIKVLRSNPTLARCTRCIIIFIKFVSELQQVGCFLRVLRFPPPIKLTITI